MLGGYGASRTGGGRHVAETDMFGAENAPILAGGLPSDESELMASMVPQTSMSVVEDQPFVERISPFDMYVDPEATCMADAKWIAQSDHHAGWRTPSPDKNGTRRRLGSN
jgi:hypothetical protein